MTALVITPQDALPVHDYGSRFIDARGHINRLSLADENPTAALAAHVLAQEAWDRSTDDEINAMLWDHGIDPAQIADYRDDVIAIAKQDRIIAYRAEKYGIPRGGRTQL
jgi:hypothetical protein